MTMPLNTATSIELALALLALKVSVLELLTQSGKSAASCHPSNTSIIHRGTASPKPRKQPNE